MSATRATGLLAPLFVPGDRPERFAKAAASGTDAIIIDLEDAVAPAAKAAARDNLASALPEGMAVILRINAAGTPWHDEDVACVARHPALGVMLPKAEDAGVLARLVERLGTGRTVVALVESALGVHRAVDIAATPGVTGLAFGPADYRNDIGCDDGADAMLLARSTLVLASRVGGLAAPLDGPCFDFRDPALTAAEAGHARGLGFGGKLCIHPAQVAWVRDAFRPTADEAAWAERVLAAAGSGGVAGVDGAMVDAPVLARARAILARLAAA